MKIIQFTPTALDELNEFKNINYKLVFKILDLISAIQINSFKGIGKPEPLKGNYTGCWSRRINDEHRLIYKVENDKIIILKCKGHYT